MRWLIGAAAALVVGWLAYSATPFVALYRLAAAVQARDVEAVARRVNFRSLRVSLTRQALASVAEAGAYRRDLEARDRQLVAEAAAGFVEPLVASLVTPETVVDLLDDGWPQTLALPPPEITNAGVRLASLRQLGRLVASSEGRGFRTVVVGFPTDRPRAQQFRLRMRLAGTTWRLVDIEIPTDLRDRLTQRLIRAAESR